MDRRISLGSLVAVGIGGLALVLLLQHPASVAARQDSASAAVSATNPAAYAVAMSGDRAVLLEVATGKTWSIEHSLSNGDFWLPIHRVDSDRDAMQFRDVEANTVHARQREAEENARRQPHPSLPPN